MFNKPCGVAYTNTPEAAVVVADKDNHRIAILLWDAKNRKLKYEYENFDLKLAKMADCNEIKRNNTIFNIF